MARRFRRFGRHSVKVLPVPKYELEALAHDQAASRYDALAESNRRANDPETAESHAAVAEAERAEAARLRRVKRCTAGFRP